MKKYCLASIIVLLLLVVPSLTVSANAPPPVFEFFVRIENAPSEAAFVDLLVGFDGRREELYREFNEESGERYGVTPQSGIAAYNEDGYMSMLFHNSTAEEVDMRITNRDNVEFYFTLDGFFHMASITDTFKIAIADENGEIIHISEAINIWEGEKYADGALYTTGITYDADSGEYELRQFPHLVYRDNPAQYQPSYDNTEAYVYILVIMLLSVGVETLIAVPFKIRPLRKVAVVNLITQIVLICIVYLTGLRYFYAVFIGEAFVYFAECKAYLLMFKSLKKSRIVIYTIVANTVTLLIGLVMLSLLWSSTYY